MGQGLGRAALCEPRSPSDHPCMERCAECRGLEDELVTLRAELVLRKTRGLGKSDMDFLQLILNRQTELYLHVCHAESEGRRTA